MRLGFVASSVARPELKSHDSRRWQNNPHLTVSLAFLHDMFVHLADHDIVMYRISSDVAPYATHPDLVQFHRQVDESLAELAAVGDQARHQGLRLSFHPGQHVVLNAPDPVLVERSCADVTVQAQILEAMGLGPEAVAITHLGGTYGDRMSARERFLRTYLSLPQQTSRRLVLENDDSRFSVEDTIWVHSRCGIRLVFDYLHHRLNNPSNMPQRDALASCLDTWPIEETPKVHFSSPRTELQLDPASSRQAIRVRQPRWSRHADFANPFEFVDFLTSAQGLRPFDVMLELRAKDLALMQLRKDLRRFAPDLAAMLEPRAMGDADGVDEPLDGGPEPDGD